MHSWMPRLRRHRNQIPFDSSSTGRLAAPRFGHQVSVMGFPSGVKKTNSSPSVRSLHGNRFRRSRIHGSIRSRDFHYAVIGEGTLSRQLHTAPLPAPRGRPGDGTPGSLFCAPPFIEQSLRRPHVAPRPGTSGAGFVPELCCQRMPLRPPPHSCQSLRPSQ